jgi:ferredoxin-NADP reductase/fatty acid desaturase
VHAAASFAMFTVLHESVHHAAGRASWVNQWLGRLSAPFVTVLGTFPMFRFIHIEHHRNTNEDIYTDPDAWTEQGPAWQLPFRWLTMDIWYLRFYLPRVPRRPRREVLGFVTNLLVVLGVLAALVATGHGWELLVICLIPQRIALGVLAWWFDWLPHHDLGVSARVNRFQATRVRVGWERALTPLMFYQNYHLVHHIHPTIPFYRYVDAWRNTEGDYLDRHVPIATAWGRELTPTEYRAWRQIAENYQQDTVSAQTRTGFYPLTVSDVRRLTDRAVSITFEVPDDLRDTFAFRPGQHLAVRATINDTTVRRTYSICTMAGSGVLRIAVQHVDGGLFSTFATTRLRAGDVLEVMPPAGSFTLTPEPTASRHLAVLAAGSGITPLISIVASTLAGEPHTRATLLYANRSAGSTMFADELSMLARQFEGRLRIVHLRSRDTGSETRRRDDDQPDYERILPERLTAESLGRLLTETAHRGHRLADADAWYLCGPQQLTDTVTHVLSEHGVPRQHVHRELFAADEPTFSANQSVVPASVRLTLDGHTHQLSTTGDESLLEAALRSGLDVPYSCTGGACGTCVARLRTGSVHMEQNYALTDEDITQGQILTCQSRPTTDTLHIDYDGPR